MASDVYSELLTKLNYFDSAHLRPVMQKLVTPEEGRLLLELPAETAELAEKLGWDEESVSSQLAELRQRGLVVDTRKGPQFLRSVPQLHDITTCSADEWVDTELLDLWKEFYEKDWTKRRQSSWPMRPRLTLTIATVAAFAPSAAASVP